MTNTKRSPSHTTDSQSELREAVEGIRERTELEPEVALVLGSGLGDLADAVEEVIRIPTTDLPGYPHSTVEGHEGTLVFGTLEGVDVVFVRGRVHMYEGLSARRVTFPIRLVHALGAERLLVTNAAGSLNPYFRPGTLMFITDHINMAFENPLIGPNDGLGPRFPDMSAPYDPAWTDRAEAVALEEGIATERGVYLWTKGPSYETPAEVRAHRLLGGDVVGMSTVPEVIQAVHRGMRVLGISTVTNMAAGMGHEKLDHQDVLEVGKQVRGELERLVRAILREVSGS